MPGKVIAGHARYEEDCKSCHVRFDKGAQTGLCLDCHKEVASDVRARQGFHGRQKEQECRACHGEHVGREGKIAAFDKNTFDHGQTDFILRDRHKEARCEDCHKKGKYREAPADCNACHRKDDVHKGGLGEKCGKCHDEKNWKQARFDHEKTRFPIAGGKHADVKCRECHSDRSYKNTPRDCSGCHRKDDQDRGHKGRYGNKCEVCHGDRGWKELRFNHDADTRLPLRGKHQKAKCDSCHSAEKGMLYQQKLSQKCISCHKKDDQEKGHGGGLGDKCETCHNEKGWKNSSFDHDKDTRFALRDKHKSAKCETCHLGVVSGPKARLKLETACVVCHRKDDGGKGHKGRYGEACGTCHGEKGWTPGSFDHDRDTKYLLRGKHLKPKCDDCHRPEFGPIHKLKLETRCIVCHKKDDRHKAQLGDRCESCHNERHWRDAPYDHARARFPLTGAHVTTPCAKCHATPAFRDAPAACNGCHDKEDVHKKRLGPKCDGCHNTRSWKSWDFNHDLRTRFKLDGAHRKAACLACHDRPVEEKFGTPLACGGCHRQEDVHDGGFGQQCERCHGTSNFREIKIY